MSFNELLTAFGFRSVGGVWRNGPHAVATVAGGFGLWNYTGPAGNVSGIDQEDLASHLRKLKVS